MTARVQFGDTWLTSPEIDDLETDVIVFHLSALSWSAQHLTDGWVPRKALRHLRPVDDVDAVIAALVAAHLWERVGDGFQLSTWEAHIIAKEKQEKWVEDRKLRQERWRLCKGNDHSKCERCWWVRANKDKARNALRDASSDASRNAPSSHVTSPSRHVEDMTLTGTEGGSGSQHDGSAAASSPPPPQDGKPTTEPVTLAPGVIVPAGVAYGMWDADDDTDVAT